jgi:hypothetical protein
MEIFSLPLGYLRTSSMNTIQFYPSIIWRERDVTDILPLIRQGLKIKTTPLLKTKLHGLLNY